MPIRPRVFDQEFANRVIQFYQNGGNFSRKETAQHFLAEEGRERSTIYRIINRFVEREDITFKKGTGRPKTQATESNMQRVKELFRKEPSTSLRQGSKILKIPKTSLSEMMKALGLKSNFQRVVKKVPKTKVPVENVTAAEVESPPCLPSSDDIDVCAATDTIQLPTEFPSMLNLIGHCSICLRLMERLNSNSGRGRPKRGYRIDGLGIPRATFPPEIATFQHIWPYLLGKGKLDAFKEVKFVSDFGEAIEIPPTCNTCGEKLLELDRLHRELIRKVQEIRKIIVDTGGMNRSRRDNVTELLRNSLIEPAVTCSTFNFLEHLSSSATKWIEESVVAAHISQEGSRNDSPDISVLIDDKVEFSASISVPLASIIEAEDSEKRNCTIERGMKLRKARKNKATLGRPRKVPIPPLSEESEYCDPTSQPIKEEVLSDEDVVDFPMQHDEIKQELNSGDENGTNNEADPDHQLMEKVKRKRVKATPKRQIKGLRRKRKAIKRLNPKRPFQKREKAPVSTCEICSERLTVPDMYEHMQSHIGDFTLKCPNPSCLYAYSNPRTMARYHIIRSGQQACRMAAERVGNVCETCGFRDGSTIAFRAHLITHETDIKNVTCPLSGCEEGFTVRQNVYEHIYQDHLRTRVTIQKCIFCRKYWDVNKIEVHLKDAHGLAHPIKCQQCPFFFHNWDTLLDHAKVHRNESAGVICYICKKGVKFQTYNDLRRHYYNEHQIGEQFVCEECGKAYTTLYQLNAHRNMAMGHSHATNHKNNVII